MARLPNILLIVADCARADKWLGPGRRTVTPNLDRLAAAGVSFNTVIAEKACTTPCFASLLTGLYSPRHGVHLVWGYRLPERVPLLTEVLARRGYHAYAEVSGPLLPEMGLARGFEHYEYRAPCDLLHSAWGDRLIERLRSGHYRRPWFILLHLWELHPHRHVEPACDTERFGADTYERAVSSLDRQLARLFAAVDDDTLIAFTGDHGEKTQFETYRPGTAVDYARRLLGIDESAAAADSRLHGLATYGVVRWAGPSVLNQLYGINAPLMRNVRLRDAPAGQAAETHAPRRSRNVATWRDRLRLLWLTPQVFLHDLLAPGRPLRLTRMLERRGLLDASRARRKVERLARFIGRQELLDMHMRIWANSYRNNLQEGHMLHVYDFLVRVPLVLHWPDRLPAGLACERMVRQPDILPTVLDLIGIDPVECGEIDGRSFGWLAHTDRPMTGAAGNWPTGGLPSAFLSLSGLPPDLELRGVRTQEYKYTFGPHNDELPQELYDLRADPGEATNLAPARRDLCAELRALADGFVRDRSLQAADVIELTPDDRRQVEGHLRRLGYLE